MKYLLLKQEMSNHETDINNEVKIIPNKSINWIGDYYINAKAISNYNKKEIDQKYYISITDNYSTILSIRANQTQDYLCEGEYHMIKEKEVLKTNGKYDVNDINDFYLKFEKW